MNCHFLSSIRRQVYEKLMIVVKFWSKNGFRHSTEQIKKIGVCGWRSKKEKPEAAKPFPFRVIIDTHFVTREG